jgi:MFS family permease
MYTLVMASFMITGGKVGQILGRKRSFVIGCFIYAAGSLTTAVSQSLPMLMFGWSLLEGIGAVLILPAIVALVASNFAREDRPRAYGLLAAAMAIAIAAGPLIGGVFTTYLSWRWVFVGEVIVIAGILLFSKRIKDTLSSQLGAVAVGAVPDERSGEFGGLQNTATNLGSSIAPASRTTPTCHGRSPRTPRCSSQPASRSCRTTISKRPCHRPAYARAPLTRSSRTTPPHESAAWRCRSGSSRSSPW